MLKPCIDCGTPTSHTRCPQCHTPRARPRPSSHQRGLGAQHQRIRQIVLAEETYCWRCGKPVDKRLPGTHPHGPTADHIHDRADGGANHRANYRLAHRQCNSRAGGRRPRRRAAG